MNAAVFESLGEPAEVLRVAEAPTPEPGPGQVLVRMIASPINPSDLLYVRGRYTVRPNPPARPGFEGVGVVERAGPGIYGRWLVNRKVAVLNSEGGNWAEYAVIPSMQAIPVPNDLPDEQAAAFFVNPATALAMTRHVLKIPQGAWLLQSAANSELGKMIIRLAHHDGFKTVNVVRRPEAAEALKALGADAVVCVQDGPVSERVREAVGPEGVPFALDAVGGAIGTELFDSLTIDGTLLVYGSLSNEPIQVQSRRLISGRRIQGFWLGKWMRDRPKLAALPLFREIANLIRQGVLATEVGDTFGLDRIAEAVQAAERPGRNGKTYLKLTS